MKRHWAYFKYVIRHKWFVVLAGWKLRASPWRILVHDLSKFLPSEWVAYARTFYAPNGRKQYQPGEAFDRAWLAHQHRNKHHWQYWMLKEDSGAVKLLDMPGVYIDEMIADWAGAGRAISGRWEVAEWYARNQEKILLSDVTRAQVELTLNKYFGYKND